LQRIDTGPTVCFDFVRDSRVGPAVSHVQAHSVHGGPRFELGARRHEGFVVEIRQRELRTGAGEGSGDAEPDAACTAGDENRPTFDSVHVHLPRRTVPRSGASS
jgi:hypothetical protein